MSQLAKAVTEQINELNKLLQTDIDNNHRFQVKKRKMELFHQLDRIVEADLSGVKNSKDFIEALEKVKAATKSAKEAKKDIAKVVKALNDAAQAINKVEKVVKGVVGVVAVL